MILSRSCSLWPMSYLSMMKASLRLRHRLRSMVKDGLATCQLDEVRQERLQREAWNMAELSVSRASTPCQPCSCGACGPP